jgi:hypothetical protein
MAPAPSRPGKWRFFHSDGNLLHGQNPSDENIFMAEYYEPAKVRSQILQRYSRRAPAILRKRAHRAG